MTELEDDCDQIEDEKRNLPYIFTEDGNFVDPGKW